MLPQTACSTQGEAAWAQSKARKSLPSNGWQCCAWGTPGQILYFCNQGLLCKCWCTFILYVGDPSQSDPSQHPTDRTEHHTEVDLPFLIRMCKLSADYYNVSLFFMFCLARAARQVYSVSKRKIYFQCHSLFQIYSVCTSSTVWQCPFQYLLQCKTWPGLLIIQNWVQNGLSDDISNFKKLQQTLAFNNCSWRLIKLVLKTNYLLNCTSDTVISLLISWQNRLMYMPILGKLLLFFKYIPSTSILYAGFYDGFQYTHKSFICKELTL